jgi:predicted nucleic acid-binding protein
MIVVNTNVLSEEMKSVPAASVHAWFLRQNAGDLFTTAVCEAEILLGVAILPDGQRKRELEVAARSIIALFAGRILSFDSAAATAYADIVAERRRIGRPIDDFDAQIAAISRSRGFKLATRNGPDFDRTGVLVIDPWAA